MKKKMLILSSIIAIGLIIITIFIYKNLKNDSTSFETSQANIINDNSLNVIENETLNEVVEENTVEVAQTTNSLTENINTKAETNILNTSINNTVTKDEPKSDTKATTNTSGTINTSSTNTTNNTNISTPSETKQETSTQITNNQSVSTSEETSNTTTEDNSRPELAYSTYRVTNTEIIPEVIKILNDEISKYDDLVSYGCKVLQGNKSSAYEKTTGFTYLFVSDINKGKVAGNYVTFENRVRNSIGAYANYNVYAEDEYTYNGQGLNPKWCQTLVWIYPTF